MRILCKRDILVKSDIHFRSYVSYTVDKFYYFFPDFYIFLILLLICVLNIYCMISAFGKAFLSLYSINVKLFWKLIKVFFECLCINKIYCKRGVLCAKIAMYPAFTVRLWVTGKSHSGAHI